MSDPLLAPPSRRPTPEEVETFWSDGVVCLPGIVDAECVAALSRVVDQIATSPDMADLSAMADSLGAHRDAGGGASGHDRGRFISGVDLRYGSPLFDDFCLHGPIGAIVGELLSARGSRRVRLYEDSILIKEAHSEEPTRWHTDLGYFQVSGTAVATSWIALDRVTGASGALSFVRGSHLWDRDFRPNLFVSDQPIGDGSSERVPDIDAELADHEILSYEMEPGDLTVHHARTLHGAGPNRSGTQRRAVSLRYVGDDVVVRRRPDLPVKDHQAAWIDGDPVVDDVHHPAVWSATPT